MFGDDVNLETRIAMELQEMLDIKKVGDATRDDMELGKVPCTARSTSGIAQATPCRRRHTGFRARSIPRGDGVSGGRHRKDICNAL